MGRLWFASSPVRSASDAESEVADEGDEEDLPQSSTIKDPEPGECPSTSFHHAAFPNPSTEDERAMLVLENLNDPLHASFSEPLVLLNGSSVFSLTERERILRLIGMVERYFIYMKCAEVRRYRITARSLSGQGKREEHRVSIWSTKGRGGISDTRTCGMWTRHGIFGERQTFVLEIPPSLGLALLPKFSFPKLCKWQTKPGDTGEGDCGSRLCRKTAEGEWEVIEDHDG